MSIKQALLPVYCCLLIALFAIAPAVNAQTPDDELERQAQAIDRMIMCPVCPAETIDQAQVEISFQMRAIVRDMLAEGRSREEVLDFFVDRYGPDILAAPPKSGRNLLAWIIPIVAVAAGLAGAFLIIRAMTGRSRPFAATVRSRGHETAIETSNSQLTDPELDPYLEIADRLLASRRMSRPVPATPSGSSSDLGSGIGGGVQADLPPDEEENRNG